MKSTLIFLSFFLLCFAKVSAKIDTIYTEENGLVKMTIQQIPDVEPKVLKEQTFQNNTEFQYTTEEVTQLLSGGVVVKNDKPILTSLFPPKLSRSWQEISFVNGAIVSKPETIPVEFFISFFIFGIAFPCIILLFVPLRLSKMTKKQSFLFYLLPFVFTVVGIGLGNIFTSFEITTACTLFSFIVFTSLGLVVNQVTFANSFTFTAIGVAATFVAVGNILTSLAHKNLVVQYFGFVIVLSIIGFLLRKWSIKRKERKKLA